MREPVTPTTYFPFAFTEPGGRASWHWSPLCSRWVLTWLSPKCRLKESRGTRKTLERGRVREMKKGREGRIEDLWTPGGQKDRDRCSERKGKIWFHSSWSSHMFLLSSIAKSGSWRMLLSHFHHSTRNFLNVTCSFLGTNPTAAEKSVTGDSLSYTSRSLCHSQHFACVRVSVPAYFTCALLVLKVLGVQGPPVRPSCLQVSLCVWKDTQTHMQCHVWEEKWTPHTPFTPAAVVISSWD